MKSSFFLLLGVLGMANGEECPFNRNITGNPCDFSGCMGDFESEICQNYTMTYCEENYEVDMSCPDPCPFNSTHPASPCRVPECDQPESQACVSYVETYCSTEDDAGCVVPDAGDGCPFNQTAPDSPCLFSPCIEDSTSSSCMEYTEGYCNASDDPACMGFGEEDECPFNENVAGSPCSHPECVGQEDSVTCQNYTLQYCASHDDPGCVTLDTPSDDGCPFQDSPESPCVRCQNVTENECKNITEAYCDGPGHDDPGCIGPPDDGECKFWDIPESPCHNSDCMSSGESTVCEQYVQQYCDGVGKDDPGCGGAERPCPFDDKDSMSSPCKHADCEGDWNTTQCVTYITHYCATHTDSGCDVPQEPECPYWKNVSASPCYHADCEFDHESAACSEVAMSYCSSAEYSSDPACDEMHQDACPYADIPASPCSHPDCKGDWNTTQCMNYIADYCANHNDTACYVPDSPEPEHCPFWKNISDSPCYFCGGDGYDDPHSASCQAHITQYCNYQHEDPECKRLGLGQDGKTTNSPTVSPTAGIEYCPFNKTHPNTPCTFSDCVQDEDSESCKDYVKTYCSYANDAACASPDELHCYFSTSHQESPCFASVCHGAMSSSGCVEYTRNYCENVNPDDLECFDYGDGCPFDESRADSPCHMAECDEWTAECETAVYSYCRGNGEDAGCATLPPQDECPFNSTHPDSPCNTIECRQQPNGVLCEAIATAYCESTNPNDPGCYISDGTGCPFLAGAANSPCNATECIESPDSRECERKEAIYCEHNRDVDPGCDHIENDCPFRVTAYDTPCFAEECRAESSRESGEADGEDKEVSEQCLQYIYGYCGHNYWEDEGCQDEKFGGCSFDRNHTLSPCHAIECSKEVNSRAECRQFAEQYCEEINPTDPGCEKLNCPFKNADISPCQTDECWDDYESEACQALVREYCYEFAHEEPICSQYTTTAPSKSPTWMPTRAPTTPGPSRSPTQAPTPKPTTSPTRNVIDMDRSFVWCTMSVHAGEELECVFEGVDINGLPFGSLRRQDINMTVVRPKANFVAPPTKLEMSPKYPGMVRGTFSLTVAGTYGIKVSVFSIVKDEVETVTGNAIYVMSGPISVDTSSLTCPRTAPGFAVFFCRIRINDEFGNPVRDNGMLNIKATAWDPSVGPESTQYLRLQGVPKEPTSEDDDSSSKECSVATDCDDSDHTDTSDRNNFDDGFVPGLFEIEVQAPFSSVSGLLVAARAQGNSFQNSPSNVTIIQLGVDTQKATIDCGETNGNTTATAVAGQNFRCNFTLVDFQGALAGDDALLGALQAEGVGADGSAAVLTVGFADSVGQFYVEGIPYAAGRLHVYLTYVTANGPQRIGTGRSEVNVVAGAVDGELSWVYCQANSDDFYMVRAGDDFGCKMSLQDKYGNRAGDASVISQLAFKYNNGTTIPVTNATWTRSSTSYSDITVSMPSVTQTGELKVQFLTASPAVYIGYEAYVYVSPGEVKASESSFTCAEVIPAGAYLRCLLTLVDKYGNPATGGTVDMDLKERLAVVGETDTNQVILGEARLDWTTNEMKVYGYVKVPLLAKNVSVKVAYRGVDLSSSSSVVNVEALTIDQVGIGCPVLLTGLPVVAGEEIACDVQLFKNSGGGVTLVGDSSVASMLIDIMDNEGAKTSNTTAVYQNTVGQYRVTFKPKRAGRAEFFVAFYNGVSRLRSNMLSGKVIPGEPSASATSFACAAGHIAANETLTCHLSAADEHGNRIFPTNVSDGVLGVYAVEDSTGGIVQGSRGDNLGLLAATFNIAGLTSAGSYSVRATVGGVAMAKTEIALVQPGDISLLDTGFECPTVAFGGATAKCFIIAKDAFGNPTQRADREEFKVTVVNNSTNKLSWAQISIASESTTVGSTCPFELTGDFAHCISFKASFKAPVVSSTLYVSAELKGQTFGVTKFITVEPLQVSGSQSAFSCSVNETTVGAQLDCTLRTVDLSGNAIGDEGLLALINPVAYGVLLDSTSVEFLSTGVYRVSFLSKKAGDAQLAIFSQLSDNGKTLGTAQPMRFKAGAVSAALSVVKCTHLKAVAATDNTLRCGFTFVDGYGNIAGDLSEIDYVSISSVLFEQNPGAVGSLAWVRTPTSSMDAMYTLTGVTKASEYTLTVTHRGTALSNTANTVKLTVVGGAPTAATSHFTCPSEASGGATLRCAFTANDVFGNSATMSENAIAAIQVSGEVDSNGAERRGLVQVEQGNTIGFLRTPSNGGSVKVRFYVGKTLVTDITTGGTDTVTVNPIDVSGQLSSLACDGLDEDIRAGETVKCTISLFSSQGVAVGDESLLTLLKGEVLNAGSKLPGNIVFVSTGIYQAEIIPQFVGELKIRLVIQLGTSQSEIGSAEGTVTAGEISAEKSTLFCNDKGVDATRERFPACVVQVRDAYGNVAGESADLSGFYVSGPSIMAEAVITTEWNDQNMVSIFIENFAISGEFELTVTFLDQAVPRSPERSHVSILAGHIDADESSIDCPSTVIGGIPSHCTLVGRDKYGNPTTNLGPNEALSVRSVVGDARPQFGRVFKSRSSGADGVGLSLGDGEYRMEVTPPNVADTILISGFLGKKPISVDISATIVLLTVSYTDSQFDCEVESDLVSVGSPIDCFVYLYDSNGDPIGSSVLESSLIPQVFVLKGDRYRPIEYYGNATHTVTYIDQGIFRVSFVSYAAGNLTLGTLYEERRIGSGYVLNVSPGPVSSVNSTVKCMYTWIEAGVPFDGCGILLFDEYGNRAASDDDLSLISFGLETDDDVAISAVLPTGLSTMDHMYQSLSYYGLDGVDFVVQLEGLTTAGRLSVDVMYSGTLIGGEEANSETIPWVQESNLFAWSDNSTGILILNTYSSTVNVSRTQFSCDVVDNAVPVASKVDCHVYMFDNYGNPSSNLVDGRFTASSVLNVSGTLFENWHNVEYDWSSYYDTTTAGMGDATADYAYEEGKLTVMGFRAPPQPGTATLTLYLGTEPLATVNPITVEVTFPDISLALSDVRCIDTDLSIVAGTDITCFVNIKNDDGNAVGDSALVSSLVVNYPGSEKSPIVNFLDVGLFEVIFTPVSIRNTNLRTLYKSADGLVKLPIFSGEGNISSAVLDLDVVAADVDILTSRVNCRKRVAAGSAISCFFVLRDQYGNVAGSAETMDNFVVTSSTNAQANITTTWTREDDTIAHDMEASVSGVSTTAGDMELIWATRTNPVVSKTISVEVVPGEISLATSSYSCDTQGVSGLFVKCSIDAFDIYGNALSPSKIDFNAFSVSVVNATNNWGRVFIHEEFVYGIVKTPNVEGTIVVSIQYNGADMSSMANTVNIAPLALIHSGEMECGSEVTAGEAVDCFYSVEIDSEAEGAADLTESESDELLSALAGSFVARVKNEGHISITSDVTYVGFGTFKISFTPEKVGTAYLMLGHRGTLVATSPTIAVVAGAVVLEKSQMNCVSMRKSCYLQLRDAYGNVAGDESVLEELAVAIDLNGASVQWEWVRSALTVADAKLALIDATSSGTWSVTVSSEVYTGSLVGHIEIAAGPISPALSMLDCPAKVKGLGELLCTLDARDEFNNPTTLTSSIFMTAVDGATNRRFFGQMALDKATQKYTGSLRVPAGPTTLTVQAKHMRDFVNGTFVVQVEPLELDAGLSTLLNSDTSGESLPAGTSNVFILNLFDNATKAPTGEIDLINELRASVLTQSGVVLPRSGYNASFAFVKTGVFMVDLAVFSSGNRTLSVRFGQNFEISADLEVDVAPVSAGNSRLICREDIVKTAGSEVRCGVVLADKYGNMVSRENADLGLLVVSATFEEEGSLSISDASIVAGDDDGAGKAVVVEWSEGSLGAAGLWTLSGTWDGESIDGSTAVHILATKAAADRSVLECPEDVPGGTPLYCSLSTFDAFGNPTFEYDKLSVQGTYNDGADIFFASIVPTGGVGTTMGGFIVTTNVPFSQVGSTLQLTVNGAGGLATTAVESVSVTQMEFNSGLSTLECPEVSEEGDAFQAGDSIVCVVTLKDNEGNNVGEASLANVFNAKLAPKGVNDVSVSNLGTGVFSVVVTPRKSGVSNVLRVAFNGEQIGLAAITVKSQFPSAEKSTVRAVKSFPVDFPSERRLVLVKAYDMYNNEVDEEFLVNSSFTAVATHANNGVTVPASKVEVKASGSWVLISFPAEQLTTIGDWVVATSYLDETVGDATILATPGAPVSAVVECPTQGSAGTRVECSTFMFDAYSNPAGGKHHFHKYLTIEAQSTSRKYYPKATGTDGVGSFSFLAPGVADNVTVAVSFGVGTAAFNGVIEILPLDVSQANSEITCGDGTTSVYPAGTTLECIVSVKDSESGFIGDEASLKPLKVSVSSRGVELSQRKITTTWLETGTVSVSFTLTRAGSYDIAAKFSTGYSSHTSLGQVQTVSIEPDLIASEMALSCSQKNSVREDVMCLLKAKDSYGNKITYTSASFSDGSLTISGGIPVSSFTAVATEVVSGTAVSLQVGWTASFDASSGEIRADMLVHGLITLTGDWTIEVSLPSQQITEKQHVFVAPGDVYGPLSNVTCPESAVALSRVSCSMDCRDRYNNEISGGYLKKRHAREFVGQAYNVNETFSRYARFDIVDGYMYANFKAPATGMSVTVEVGNIGTSAHSYVPQIVEVETVALSDTLSKVECDKTTVEAGDTVSCTIQAKKADGSLFGSEEFFRSATSVQARLAGRRLGTSSYTFLTTGLLQVQFQPKKQGTLKMDLQYNKQVLVSGLDITVSPSTVDVAKSRLQCRPTVEAGKSLKCALKPRDEYGNKVTEFDTLSVIATPPVSDDNSDDSVAITADFDTSQKITVDGLTTTGVWTLTLVDANGLLGENMVEATVKGGSLDAAMSTCVCPQVATAGGVVLCEILPKDTYGNIATPSGGEDIGLKLTDSNGGISFGQIIQSTGTIAAASTDGLLLARFTAPVVAEPVNITYEGVVMVKQGVGSGNGGGVMSHPQGQVVSVQILQIDTSKSEVSCTPPSLAANEVVTCTIAVYDLSGDPVGDEGLASLFAITTINAGLPVEAVSETTNVVQGVFQFTVTPIRAGKLAISVTYRGEAIGASISLRPRGVAPRRPRPLELSGRAGRVSSARGVSSLSDVSNAEMSVNATQVRCDNMKGAGSFSECKIAPFDAFGNLAGSSLNVEAFALKASMEGQDDIIVNGLTFVQEKTWGAGYFKGQMNLTVSGVWSVKLLYLGEEIDGEAEEIRITALPDRDPSLSELACPVEGFVGSFVACKFTARDQYGNPTGNNPKKLVATALNDDSSIVNVRGVFTGTLGSFELRFKPAVTGNVTVTSDGISHVVEIFETRIDPAHSLINCPTTESTEVGQLVTCYINLMDENDVALGDASAAGFLRALIKNEGVSVSPEIIYGEETGLFLLQYTPTRAGDTQVNLAMRSRGVYVQIGSTQTLTTYAGGVSEANSLFKCGSNAAKTLLAGKQQSCLILLKDLYNNPTGSSGDEKLFSGTLTSVDGLPLSDAEIIYLGGSILQVKFIPVTAGVVRLELNFDSVAWENTVFDVIPGELDSTQTTFDCPEKITIDIEAACAVNLFDGHGNALTQFGNVQVAALADNGVVALSPYVSREDGQLLVKFTPTRLANVVLKVMVGTQVFDNIDPIVVEQFSVDPQLSSFTCATDVEFVTGDSVACTIVAKDSNGNLIGTASHAKAFEVIVNNYGLSLNVDVQFISEGLFAASFVPSRTKPDDGTGIIEVTAFGQQQLVSIVSGDIDLSMSRIACEHETVVAGSAVRCVFVAMDSYGNPTEAGVDIDSMELSMIVFEEAVTTTLASSSFTGKPRFGTFETALELTTATTNPADVVFAYAGQQIDDKTSVKVTPDLLWGEHSVLTCPDVLAKGVPITCTIEAKDRYGNPTNGGASDIGFVNGFVTKSGEAMAMTTSYDNENGVYVVDLDDPSDFGYGFVDILVAIRTSDALTANVEVKAGSICASESKAVCSTEGITAGGTISCTTQTFDCDGNPAGEGFETDSFEVTIEMDGGSSNGDNNAGGGNDETQMAGTGMYTSGTSSKQSGSGQIVMVVKGDNTTEGGRRRRRRILEGVQVTPSSLNISAGPIDAEASFVECSIGVAGDTQSCTIRALDENENPTGEASDAAAFVVQVQPLNGAPQDAVTGTVSFVAEGEFSVAYDINISDTMSVDVTYSGDDVGTAVTTISPAVVDLDASTVSCPSEMTLYSSIECQVTTVDAYSNPTSNLDNLLTAGYIDVGDTLTPLSLFEVSTGNFKVDFNSGSSPGNASVSLFKNENDTVANTAFSITVSQLNMTNSYTDCPASATSGGVIQCTIYARDDSNSPAGSVADAASFDLTVNTTASDVSITFFSAGIYKAQFTAVESGAARVSITMADSPLGSHTLDVSPGAVDAAVSTHSCSGSGQLGGVIVCNVYLKDASGNAAGDPGVAPGALSGVVDYDATSDELSPSTFLYMNVTGHYITSFTVGTVSGAATLSIAYSTVEVGTTAVVIEPNSAQSVSSLTCDDTGVIMASVRCTFTLVDEHNNLAGTSLQDFTDTGVTVNITGDLASVVEFVGPAAGSFALTFEPQGTGNFTVTMGAHSDVSSIAVGTVSTMKSVLQGAPSIMQAGSAASFSIQARDADNNATGTSSEASAFGVVFTPSIDAEASISFISTGVFSGSVIVTEVGQFTVNVTYAGTTFATFETHVLPGALEVTKSSLDCYDNFTLGSTVDCTFEAHDDYGNLITDVTALDGLTVEITKVSDGVVLQEPNVTLSLADRTIQYIPQLATEDITLTLKWAYSIEDVGSEGLVYFAEYPTPQPSKAPTQSPSPGPSTSPSSAPSGSPTVGSPTDPPTNPPTNPPVDAPTTPPVVAPTEPQATDPPVDMPADAQGGGGAGAAIGGGLAAAVLVVAALVFFFRQKKKVNASTTKEGWPPSSKKEKTPANVVHPDAVENPSVAATSAATSNTPANAVDPETDGEMETGGETDAEDTAGADPGPSAATAGEETAAAE